MELPPQRPKGTSLQIAKIDSFKDVSSILQASQVR
jgi:hypothetical protein